MSKALQIWTNVFCRGFDRLPSEVREAIIARIDDMGRRLPAYPRMRLVGRSEFKLRVGDYRVLYEFDVSKGCIHLLYVGHRREIYKRG